MAKSVTDAVPAQDELIRAYKLILQSVLDQRPSGTRQRLADSLGKHRSFITQMTSPAYPTPIPQRHLPAVFAVCHFTPEERESFLAAYRKAHRGRLELTEVAPKTRHVNFVVPDLGNAAANAEVDHAVAEFVSRISALMRTSGGDQ
jgi:hypothetical protein